MGISSLEVMTINYRIVDGLWGSIPPPDYNMTKYKDYKVEVVFKHLPWAFKTYTIKAKSEKKACDITRRMFKDKILTLRVL